MDNEKEIPFGAFDGELMHQEIFIPEGFEATIDGNKIILKKIESEDERIRKELIEHVKDQQSSFISAPDCRDKYEEEENNKYNSWLSWLEKQETSYTKRDVDDAFVEGMVFAKNELEKQGEKKSSDEVLKIRQELYQSGYNDGYKHGCEDTKKQGEQKSTNKVEPKFKVGDIVRLKDGDGLEWTVEEVLNHGYYTIVCADRDDFIQLDDKWELVEQKSWSNEDERILKGIIGFISHSQHYGVSNLEMLNWLKSIKERIGGKL